MTIRRPIHPVGCSAAPVTPPAGASGCSPV